MNRFLQRNGITTDWVRWAIGGLLVAGLFCPYLTSATATAAPAKAVSAPARANVSAQRTTEIQFLLKSFGYTIVVDGIYGPQTTRVVKAWQKANGLDVDGLVGTDTWSSLNAAVPASATNPPTSLDAGTAKAPATRVNPPEPQSTEAIIRDVWPDDLEDEAVRIAKRESGPNLKVDAANYCCYGNFQIYFSAHRAWLADYGVTKPSDLFDPRVNATVALALYNQVGWRPWNT